MLHTITGPVRNRQLFAISTTTSTFAMVLIFLIMPAFAQDDSAVGLTSAPPERPAVLTAQTASSTIPRLVTFSGVLKDAGGKPATGTVTVAFSVCELQEGGSPLWVETQEIRADAQGRYTVLLGATQPEGLPVDLFTSGRARWLGVQPQLPAAAEQPRVLLVDVPYALKATDADTLGGRPASAYVTTEMLGAPGSEVPAGAASTSAGLQPPGPKLATRQSDREASSTRPLGTSCSAVTADGTATANFVAKFTAPCIIHQSAIFESSGNVGIGNTKPAGKLDVSGNAFIRGTLNLNQTTSSSVGVINMGSNRFIHACCSSSADNTFVGINAGNFSTTGTGHNTATGFEALFSNTTGSENTATGYFALSANTTGGSNTATGHEALKANTSGFNNTATGFSAMLANSTGTDNTATGDSALNFNNTGSFNSAIGEVALGSNTTGNYNTGLGYAADVQTGNLLNATAIGAGATVSSSNALVLGCTLSCPSGTAPPNVGIGTTTPTHRLESAADANVGNNNTCPIALVSKTTPSKLLGMGFDPSLNAGFIQATQTNVGYNALLLSPFGGNVGIGTTGPDNTLTVNGTADKPGGGSWGTFSDGRLKTVAGTYEAGLDAILKLTPVRYRYKEQNAMGIKDGQEHIGFVAQEVEKVIPEAVSRNNRGYLLVNNDPILWTMLNAIKQQQAEIEALTRSAHEKDAQIQKLTEQSQALQKLQRQMAVLEGRLAQIEVKSGTSLASATVVALRR